MRFCSRLGVLWGCTAMAAAAQQAGPFSSTNIFAHASTPAKTIFGLSMFVLAITAIIFLVVAGLLVWRARISRWQEG